MSPRPCFWLGLAFSLSGCAREAELSYPPPAPYQSGVTPADYAWPPRVEASQAPSRRPQAAMQPSRRSSGLGARTPLRSENALPGGEKCLEVLRERGVPFRRVAHERGVDTPVVVTGPIHGIRFWSHAGPMLADCRFALGLSLVAPHFTALGIVSVRFSGAYVYRTSRAGRLSLHAYGLALDMHEVSTRQATYSVKRDFARGLGDGCVEDAPLLNRLYCRLLAPGLFRELLTPDYNADHHDHLHLGIAPLGSSPNRVGAPALRKPKSKAGAKRQTGRAEG